MPELHFAIAPHPIGGLRPPAVIEKAAAMVDATARAVTASATPQPAAAGS